MVQSAKQRRAARRAADSSVQQRAQSHGAAVDPSVQRQAPAAPTPAPAKAAKAQRTQPPPRNDSYKKPLREQDYEGACVWFEKFLKM